MNLFSEQAERLGSLVMKGDPTFDSDSIATKEDPTQRWNTYPGGSVCLNPSLYTKGQYVMPPMGAGLELDLGVFLGTKVLRMPDTLDIAVADHNAATGALSLSRESTWYPYKIAWQADFAAGAKVSGDDFFIDSNSTLIRLLTVQNNATAGKEQDLILTGRLYGDKGGSFDSKKGLLTVSDAAYDYALRFVSLPGANAQVVDLQIAPKIEKDRWSLRIPLKQGTQTLAVSFGIAPSCEGISVAEERAVKAFEHPVAESLALSKGVMDAVLKRVPKPLVWGLNGIPSFGVTSERHRRAYYEAWTFLCQSPMKVQPENPGYPYPQMTVGKCSLWAEGEKTCPPTCGWESLMGLQWYSFLDPGFSWKAFGGILSRVDPNGMLGGESLPSRKAQTAWMLYCRDHDEAKLRAAYPPIKRYLLWREQNPRWLYGTEHNLTDEKDLEFVASWLFDVGYMMKISEQLGMHDETALWRAKVQPMVANMKAWFFDHPDKVHQFKFLSSGADYDAKLRPSDRSTLLLSALGTGDCLPPEMFAALKRDFLKFHQPESSVDGFPEAKYPDANLIAYGLIDRGQAEAATFIKTLLRDSIRAGGFAEVTQSGPKPDGVKPSLFSPLEIIEFTWLLNGVRYDSGYPKPFVMPEAGSATNNAAASSATPPPAATQGAAASAAESSDEGKLVVCFASKGDYRHTEKSVNGLKGLAEMLHKYGYRGTFYLKPQTVAACQKDLQDWNKTYGDEVGWFAEGDSLAKAPEELKHFRDLIPSMKVRSAGQLRYGEPWVNFFSQNGIESVWGRCYEQSATDGITDRGCPFGFYYERPDCFKAPNPNPGGVISVPWLSNDLNIVFRTAQQSSYTFDPNDPQDMGLTTPHDDSFWRAEIAEYKKQAKYNKIVPLVIQQEICEFDFSENKGSRRAGADIFENLLKILKKEGIQVVTVSEAVEMYKAAYPNVTPPTYGLFGNIAATNPILRDNKSMQAVTEPFAVSLKDKYHCFGPTFNGFYPTGRIDRIWYYYDPKGEKVAQFGKNFSYYDQNGLVIFTEGDSSPARITPYSNLPKDAFNTAILPEMSQWFDTDKFIPKAVITTDKVSAGLSVSVKATTIPNTIYTGESMPYGVMLWGDYSAYTVPANAPEGSKIVGKDGLFIPMLLKSGENTLSLTFPRKS
jgi:hypothetical protein